MSLSHIQTDMHGDSAYNVMFGPDICGPGTKKVHVIFEHKGKNLLTKKEVRCKDDVYTHLYTLVVQPDGKYEVLIDNEKAESGSLEDDWDFLPAKEIKVSRGVEYFTLNRLRWEFGTSLRQKCVTLATETV